MDFKALTVFYIAVVFTVSLSAVGIAKADALKSIVTSIKTVHGDIYDCKQIFSQPSLTHPAMSGHKLQKRPSKQLQEMIAREFETELPDGMHYAEVGFKKGMGCPRGSFPVLRINRDNLAMTATSQIEGLVGPSPGVVGHEFVGIYTDQRQFLGAAAIINVYNPEVNQPHQYSSAAISLDSGDSPALSQIQVGWTVYPNLYGDRKTHWYVWTRNSKQTEGCYNIGCPGYVHLSRRVPLGAVISNTSTYGGPQYIVRFAVRRDPVKRLWYLFLNNINDPLGYWPEDALGTGGGGAAERVRLGGHVYSRLEDSTIPPMGSGHFEEGDYTRTCYMSQVTVVNGTQDVVYPDNSYIHGAVSRCYQEGGHSLKPDQYIQYSFFFGGPGCK